MKRLQRKFILVITQKHKRFNSAGPDHSLKANARAPFHSNALNINLFWKLLSVFAFRWFFFQAKVRFLERLEGKFSSFATGFIAAYLFVRLNKLPHPAPPLRPPTPPPWPRSPPFATKTGFSKNAMLWLNKVRSKILVYFRLSEDPGSMLLRWNRHYHSLTR